MAGVSYDEPFSRVHSYGHAPGVEIEWAEQLIGRHFAQENHRRSSHEIPRTTPQEMHHQPRQASQTATSAWQLYGRPGDSDKCAQDKVYRVFESAATDWRSCED